MPIPWNDQAVVSSDGKQGHRAVVMSSTLRDVVAWLTEQQPIEWKGFLIAFPDRGARPFRYEAHEISGLVHELRFENARRRQDA